jgi:tetratricopeptide (TPR) repeat protein
MTVFHSGCSLMRLPLLLTVVLAPLFAQDSGPSPWRDRVDDALEEGRERVALGLLAAEIEKPSPPAEALRLFADVAANVGEWDRADAAGARLLKEHPDDPEAKVFRARQLWWRGAHSEALAVLAPLLAAAEEREDRPKWNFPAVALAAAIHADRGEDEKASELFDSLVTESQRVVLEAPADLFALSRALLFIGGKGVRLAEKELIQLQKAGAGTEVGLELGRLYLDRYYAHGDAVLEFKDVLRKRPALVTALLGLHDAYAGWTKEAEAKAALEKAAGVNPGHPDLLAIHAREDLEGFQLDKAGEKIARGLRASPKHKVLRSLAAARDLLAGRKDAFDQDLAAILADDPTNGEALRIVAGVLNERRRWPEALELMTRAIKLDPKDPRLLDDHARYALYLGQNAVAEASLKAADAADAAGNQWRGNMWILLRWIAKRYKTVDTDRFAVRMDSDNLPALSKIVLPFFERSFEILSAKYRYTPAGVGAERDRMLIEVFREHKDFSVRTFGFNGLGALGVCFGPFIAMDAPNALPPGSFSWARTFHHELAHTMTLGLSKGRVPRWLTEGLSTFEEEEFEPSWTRGMDRELFDAYHSDDLLKVLDFDPAFMTPRIIFAYYQGGLEAKYLVKTYGMDRMLAALELFGEDLPHEEVFSRAFGVAPAVVDEGFRKFVAERIAPMKMQPRYRPEVRERMEEAWKAKPSDDLLVRLAWARFQAGKLADAEALLAEADKRGLKDDRLVLLEARIAEKLARADRAKTLFEQLKTAGVRDFDLAFDLARGAEKRGEAEEAMTLYREAIGCFPTNADKNGPRVMLARLLRGGGRADEAIALLEEHLRHSPEDLVARKAVIEAKRAAGDQKAALAHLDQYVMTQPLEDAIHVQRSEALLSLSRAEESLLAADCAVETASAAAGKAAAQVAAAKALVALGKKDEARARLEEALRQAPQNAAAKAMLAGLDSLPSGGNR